MASTEEVPLWTYGALHTPLLVESCDSDRLVSYCARYGVKNPAFWHLALVRFAVAPHCRSVKKLLERIRQSSYSTPSQRLCPLTVIRLLSAKRKHVNPHSQDPCFVSANVNADQQQEVLMGDIKDFLVESIEQIKERIDRLKRRADADLAELQQRRSQLRHVREDLHCFYVTGQPCSQCNMMLDLPIVRFLCGHVYHLLCLESYEEARKCPKCAPDNQLKNRLLKENLSLLMGADQLNSSCDNLLQNGDTAVVSYVAAFLGHGLMRTIRSPRGQVVGSQKSFFSETVAPSSEYSSVVMQTLKRRTP